MGIRVRIDLDADTSKLSAAIQKGVAQGFQGAGASGLATNPAGIARQILGEDQFTSSAIGMKRRSRGNLNVITPPMPDFFKKPGFFNFSGTPPPTIASVRAQQVRFLKQMGVGMAPIMNPTSIFGNMAASHQIFSGMSGPVGQRVLGGLGMAGGAAGAAAATGGIMAILLAVGLALKALIAAIKETAKAYEEARKLYAKSLLSGLGLRFTIGRSNLADIIGVNEKEVMQFAAAMAILGPKLRFASDTVARFTPNLTSVAWQFGILGKNLEALFFTMANEAAPALRQFADAISKFVVAFSQFLQHDPIGKFLMSFTVGKYSSLNIISKLLGGQDMGAAPTPQGLMKQLPASHLERMGLVVGGFGVPHDAMQRTAKATERTAKLMEKLVGGMSGGGGASFGDPLMNMP